MESKALEKSTNIPIICRPLKFLASSRRVNKAAVCSSVPRFGLKPACSARMKSSTASLMRKSCKMLYSFKIVFIKTIPRQLLQSVGSFFLCSGMSLDVLREAVPFACRPIRMCRSGVRTVTSWRNSFGISSNPHAFPLLICLHAMSSSSRVKLPSRKDGETLRGGKREKSTSSAGKVATGFAQTSTRSLRSLVRASHSCKKTFLFRKKQEIFSRTKFETAAFVYKVRSGQVVGNTLHDTSPAAGVERCFDDVFHRLHPSLTLDRVNQQTKLSPLLPLPHARIWVE